MGVIKALNAVSGTAFPQFFVLHHSPTENDALVCTAENPRTLEFLQEVLDLLLAAPNHPCKDSRKDRPKDILATFLCRRQRKVAIGCSLMHEGEHVDPQAAGRQGAGAQSGVMQPITWIKLK